MHVNNGIMKRYLVELMLIHLPDETLSKLQAKVPQKQGGKYFLNNHNKVARKNCIKLLTNVKNINYVNNFLESGQINIQLEEGYLLGEKLVSLAELKEMIKDKGGNQLGYLIFVIEHYKLSGLNELFNGNPNCIQSFVEFLEKYELQDYIIESKPNSVPEINPKHDNEFEIKYNKLKKKVEQNGRKEEKNIQHQKKILKQLQDKNMLYEKQLNDIKEQLLYKDSIIAEKKLELEKSNRSLESTDKKNNKLTKNISELTQKIENLKDNQNNVLVVGNLPNNSILDNLNYHIMVLPNTIKIDEVISKNEFVKVYIQSEYVSVSEYYGLKDKFIALSFEYTSRESMIKE